MTAGEFGIHGNSTYIDFKFSFFTFPMLLLFLPILYIPVTLIVDLRIFYKLLNAKKNKNINALLFKAICMSQLTDILYFICDYFHIRLPTTGIFTSWCASVAPNGFIISNFIITFYIGYAAMLFPPLIATMRLNLILFPQKHEKINRIILKVAVPVIMIYPLFCTFFMFTAVGFCWQAGWPFGFGAVIISFTGTLFGLTNNYFLFSNTILWMLVSLSINGVLIYKLLLLRISLSHHARSQHSYKTELSLTLTTITMIFSYLSSGIIVVSYQLFPAYTYFAIMLRPFGNDLEMCMVPWVFYLTHPVFRRKRRIGNVL